jgi:hypothetical protein
MYNNQAWGENEGNKMNIEKLNLLNKQLDEELNRIKPVYQPKFLQIDNSNIPNMHASNIATVQVTPTVSTITPNAFPKLNGLDNNTAFQADPLARLNETQNNPACLRREGMLKIRDIDQRDKDVVVTYAILTKGRLSYFVNAKDETSIQGSIELAKIKESIKIINGFNSCFTVKTIDGISDCSICAESEDSAREWINSITQNTVNCNTLSNLNNLNKRSLLK